MPFGSLWIPVVVSAVVVFILSSLIHMALRYHRADVRPLPDDAAVRTALGTVAGKPGQYMTPFCADPSQMKDPAIQEAYAKGPIAFVTVLPKGPPAMGKYLGMWFLLAFFIAFTTGYIARHSLDYGSDGLTVMRVTGAVTFLAYGISHISDSIWKGQPWSNTLRALLDALIYAIGTGLVFRLLWPAAPGA